MDYRLMVIVGRGPRLGGSSARSRLGIFSEQRK